MTGASCAFRVLAAGFFALLSAGGCFSDPTATDNCNPGMEGCACVELECEQGLSCMGGMCIGPPGTGTGSGTAPTESTTSPASASTNPSTTGTSEPGETTDRSTGDPATSTSSSSTAAGDSEESGQATSSSTGAEDLCGNFVTDPGEECDMGNGCNDDCTLEFHDCNPLNNVPCPPGHKCSWAVLMEDPFTAYFTCSPIDDDPIGIGEGDCFEGNDAQDQMCDYRLACYLNTFLDTCNDTGGCCTEYCDTEVDDEDQCSIGGTSCEPEMDLAPGLQTLGVCR